jgi:exo-poly-alpha-galacturonosidase
MNPKMLMGFRRLLLVWLGSFAIGVGHAAQAEATGAPAAPLRLRVPALAYDEKSILLVWEKPENYADIVDYAVYMQHKKLGNASTNYRATSPAAPYVDAFYAQSKQPHVRITMHNFAVTGLRPNTEYTFTVRALSKAGKESPDSNPATQKTASEPKVLNIQSYGARADGRTTNTRAIQAAIDACPAGGKVLVPRGIWRTGALFLKSHMTLEIAEGATLLGSDQAADYPLERGYRLYPYSTHDRPPSLINALGRDQHRPGAFTNLRIVGGGIIDGNGWKRAGKPTVTDETGRQLPVYVASNHARVRDDGILAKAQFEQGVADGLDAKTAYGQRRSSLMLVRGGRDIYIGGLTLLNPAFHGIMVLESENVVANGLSHKTYDANNADGIEFGNSAGGIVLNNFFDTGDDAMNFAAGTGLKASKQPPQENTWVFNNYFRRGHGAVVAGSHTGAWIQGILAEDNLVDQTDVGLRCKSTVYIGGGARNLVFRDHAMKNIVKQAFIFTLDYADANAALDYPSAKVPAIFRDITVKNVSVEKTRGKEGSIVVRGHPAKDAFHQGIWFENVAFFEVNPASIRGLKASTFKNVTFQHLQGGAPWSVEESETLHFIGTTPKP